MPSKGREKKDWVGAPAVIPKKKSKWPAHRSQCLPVYSPAVREVLSDKDKTGDSPVETVEMGTSRVMDLLLDILSFAGDRTFRENVAHRMHQAPVLDFAPQTRSHSLMRSPPLYPRKRP